MDTLTSETIEAEVRNRVKNTLLRYDGDLVYILDRITKLEHLANVVRPHRQSLSLSPHHPATELDLAFRTLDE